MSRHPVVVILSILVGLVVGFAAGYLAADVNSKAHAKAGPAATLTVEERSALEARARKAEMERDDAKKELAGAQAALSQRTQERPAGSPGAAAVGAADGGAEASMTEDQKRARLEELAKEAEKAEASKDGKALLAALKVTVELGEVAYPKVVELLGLIFQDMFGERKYKLQMPEVFKLLASKPFVSYAKWTLLTPSVDSEARRGSVESLVWSNDPESGAFLEGVLKTEKDRLVAKSIIDNFAWRGDPHATEAIRAVLETRRDSKQMRMDAVNALWQLGDEEAMKALTSAAQGDADADVREAARIASRGIDPPVAGYMVNYIDTETGPAAGGLKRGDIVLAYNGRAIADTNTLGKESQTTEGKTEVPIQIYRDGQVVNLNVKGGAIDVWGRYVKPK